MVEVRDGEYWEPGLCIGFDVIDYIVWSREAAGQLAWEDVEHTGGVGDDIVLALYGNLLLYEVRVTHVQ